MGRNPDREPPGGDSILAAWGFPEPRQQLVVLAVATFLIWSLESLFE